MPQIETFMSSKTAMFGLAIVAFLVAALLVLVIVRMLFGGRLRMPGGRARQARLGIVDAFDLDRQRQLIIVRRDNTEHLIMIGGPNDLLIESEIVRVESRDARDGRRDKQDTFPSTSDARIPAPFTPVIERPEPKLPDQPRAPALEPAFTLPLPNGPIGLPTLDASPPTNVPGETPVRTPTFPLPPRRPMPAPPRLPESVSRMDDGPPATATPMIETPPPSPAAETGPAPEPIIAGPPSQTVRTTPPFLKPLPPRPPLRPLQRTTPQAPNLPAPASGSTSDVAPAPVVAPPKPRPPLSTAVPKPVSKPAPAPPPAPPAPESQDALESLEEEMAKLLGRGPS